jgi:flagellar hook-basal body complex protein FliE
MIVPAVGALGGSAAAGLSLTGAEALGTGTTPAPAQGTAPGSVGPTEAPGAGEGASAVEGVGGESAGFGGALTEAISSLEKSQQSAAGASQALATGTVKDPESAVVTVEDAQMAMQLAAQLRSKATEAIQTIFQTQA